MYYLNTLLIEIFTIFGVIILIFIYSIISSDNLTSFLSFLIFLILLIPFYILLNKLELFVYFNNLEDNFFFKYIIYSLNIIILFIGISLFIEMIYLFIYY